MRTTVCTPYGALSLGDTFLRYDILNNQLRAIFRGRIPTQELDGIHVSVIVIIQLEPQTELGCARQIDVG